MTPEETLNHLKSISSPRTHRTLEAIYNVCQDQENLGIHDFSYSTIARLGEKSGVPRAQSIRNKTGENYRVLIQSFTENSSTRKPIKNTKPADSWIDDIKDPKLKLLVQIQASKLSEANRLIKEIVPPETEIYIYDNQGQVSIDKLDNLERKALEYLISNEFLEKWEFKIGERGDVIDNKGNKIFKIATIDAIKKSLDTL